MFDFRSFNELPTEVRSKRLRDIDAIIRTTGNSNTICDLIKRINSIYSHDNSHVTELFRNINKFLHENEIDKIKSRNTLSRFITGNSVIPKNMIIVKLYVFSLFIRDNEKTRIDVIKSINNIFTFSGALFQRLELFLADGNPRDLLDANDSEEGGTLPSSIQIENIFSFFKSREQYKDILFRFLFSTRDYKGNVINNESYYLCFRYSTTYGNILKSFLVIKTPAKNRINQFSFVHIIQGGLTRGRRSGQPEIRKIVRGYILTYAVSCYLVGYMTRNDDEGYNSESDALEVIALEYEHLRKQRPFVPCVTMSAAAVNQPIISRAILVKVGDMISAGRNLHHSEVCPAEFSIEDLDIVVNKDIENLEKLGFVIKDKLNVEETVQNVKEYINNTALWERSTANPERDFSAENAGALEIWRTDMRP